MESISKVIDCTPYLQSLRLPVGGAILPEHRMTVDIDHLRVFNEPVDSTAATFENTESNSKEL